MKNIYLIFIALLVVGGAKSQSITTTTVGSLNIVKKIIPPILDIIPGSVRFSDLNKNNAIDANEYCYIIFTVKNSGKGDAHGCSTKIKATGTLDGIEFNKSTNLDVIKAGEIGTISIPIIANINTLDGDITLLLSLYEPNGFGTDPTELNIITKSFEAPHLKIVEHKITGGNSGVLSKREAFNLQLLLQNTKYGRAEDVKVDISVPKNVFIIENAPITKFNYLDGNDIISLEYGLIVNNEYTEEIIPITVKISEKYGKYAETKVIDLRINQILASNKIILKDKSIARGDIQIASLSSDVDRNIPETDIVNSKTFAVVISNENYQIVDDVPFALNDGRVFAEYCKKTLGVPYDNIKLIPNATLGNMKASVNWISNVIKAFDGEAKVIFYYAGHGIPNENDRTTYLLPIDGYGTDISTAYKLDELYTALGKLPTKSVTIFLDACFSGADRQGKMLTSARGIAIKAKPGAPVGNMIVFSAAQGDETAYPYLEQQHGMFTYYLLKKLQKNRGNVSYEKLGNYLTTKVSRQSIVINGKSQTPNIISSPDVSVGWKEWKLN